MNLTKVRFLLGYRLKISIYCVYVCVVCVCVYVYVLCVCVCGGGGGDKNLVRGNFSRWGGMSKF